MQTTRPVAIVVLLLALAAILLVTLYRFNAPVEVHLVASDPDPTPPPSLSSPSVAPPATPPSHVPISPPPPPLPPPPTPSSSSSWYEINPFQTCSVRNASVAEILSSDPLLSDPRSIINPLALKLMADAYFGKGAIPDGYGEVLNRKRLDYVVSCLQPGAVVFVVTRSLRQFFERYYDRIAVPFVLVSGDSDLNVPKSVLSEETVARVLHGDKSKIIYWYAMNCDSNPAPAKFRCLPNGISQWNGQIETMKQLFAEGVGVAQYVAAAGVGGREQYGTKKPAISVSKKQQLVEQGHRPPSPLKNDSYSILVSFSVDSNREVRQPAWEYLCPNAPNNHLMSLSTAAGNAAAVAYVSAASTAATAATGNGPKRIALTVNATATAREQRKPDKPYAHCSFLRPISQHEFYHQLAESKFVLSPHGRGLDCYRTYEALSLGAFVVVRSSSLDEIYDGLPVLIVDKWEHITEELLDATYKKFSAAVAATAAAAAAAPADALSPGGAPDAALPSNGTRLHFEKLFSRYWVEQFHSHGYPVRVYLRGPLSFFGL